MTVTRHKGSRADITQDRVLSLWPLVPQVFFFAETTTLVAVGLHLSREPPRVILFSCRRSSFPISRYTAVMAISAREAGALTLSVVIPAYNENLRLPATLTDVMRYLGNQEYVSELVIIDDGATDGTAEVVRAAQRKFRPRARTGLRRVELLQYPDRKNRGKGYAVRTGMLAACGQYCVFMDADNSTTIDHVEKFLPYFTRDEFDIVIGSRGVVGTNITIRQPRIREIAGNLGNALVRLLLIPGIYDTQAGFKMFTARCVADVFPRLTIDRWGFDMEILAVARTRGYRIKEAPITWHNDARSLVTTVAYLQVLSDVLRIRWNLWRGVYGR